MQLTFKDLKDFINSLSEEQLEMDAYFENGDLETMGIGGFSIVDHDVYSYNGDLDTCGAIEDLKVLHDDDFDESLCALVTKTGTPYLHIEYADSDKNEE